MQYAICNLQSYKSLDHRALRGQLQPVVQRHKLGTWPVAPPQRQANQVVGEKRILGQQRAMHVAAKCVAVDRALAAIFAIVAVASQHTPKWPRARPQVGAPAMVFEADELAIRD